MKETDVCKVLIFPSLKNSSPGQFLGSSSSRTYHWLLKLLLQLKNQTSGSKIVCSFSIILTLKGIMTFYSQRFHISCWNWKWKIPPTLLEKQNLCFSSNKNRKLKVKLWWVGAWKRKKEEIFCTVYCVWRKFC